MWLLHAPLRMGLHLESLGLGHSKVCHSHNKNASTINVKVCPWCGVGLLFLYLFFTRSAASYKITLLFGVGGSR